MTEVLASICGHEKSDHDAEHPGLCCDCFDEEIMDLDAPK